jgi:hypothetical protein
MMNGKLNRLMNAAPLAGAVGVAGLHGTESPANGAVKTTASSRPMVYDAA